ncbi:MAG: YigZ family protein [Bacteroidales bacterium]|nr:YigZ family protein [Bacteroidales bacterium]MBN2819650.1 YigZ family protein [Bacteroidales bacterium]
MGVEKDTYYTIKSKSEGLFKDKGSKFLAFAFPVLSEEKVKDIVAAIKKQYHDARHHCYAYRIGLSEDCYRYNDDGEPSGTAGKPIYGQILSNDLSDVLIVVVRYFGGTLLGTSGLIQAYKAAAADAISNSEIIEKTISKPLGLKFAYDYMSTAMRLVKQENLEIEKQDFTETCRLFINIRSSKYMQVKQLFEKTYGIEVVEV